MSNRVGEQPDRPRVVVVGAGFAGLEAARGLEGLAREGAVEVVLVNPTDYFLYLPLLPEVTAGVLDPRRVAISLRTACPSARLVLGRVDRLDLDARRVHLVDPEGRPQDVCYDRLVLANGSTNKLLPIPGVAEHAHGYRSVAEALYLRDHLIRQIELAEVAGDPAEREARCTFVVVGAGYTGTEVAAAGQLFTRMLAGRFPTLREQPVRWLLVDLAPRVLPGLDRRLSSAAHRTLARRGVRIALGESVEEATHDGVRLTDGEFVPTRTLVWCVGVRPDPLVERLGLATQQGRLTVDEYLHVPGHPECFACGDIAAVPDLTRPGELTGMTAQHAVRQGAVAAHNVAASLTHGKQRAYRHRDLGFVVDLAGAKATANPFGIPLSGIVAKAVTRGYHLLSLPAGRIRVASDWALDAVLPRQAVEFGLIRSGAVPLESTPVGARRSAGSEPR